MELYEVASRGDLSDAAYDLGVPTSKGIERPGPAIHTEPTPTTDSMTDSEPSRTFCRDEGEGPEHP